MSNPDFVSKYWTRILAIGFIVFSLLISTAVMAEPIPGVYSSGVDDNGNLLPTGVPDIHYSGNPMPTGTLSGGWTPNTGSSQWVNPAGDGLAWLPPGNYYYTLTFDLTGFDPATAVIEGAWASDNQSTIFLNGQPTGYSLGLYGFFDLNPFSLSTGFLPGINQLTFLVTNGFMMPDGPNPTGLQVLINRADAAVDLLAPSDLTATAQSSTQIELTWNDNSDNEDGFLIERKDTSSDFVEIAQVNINETTYMDSGLLPNITYSYRIRAFKGINYSQYSNEALCNTLYLAIVEAFMYNANQLAVKVAYDFGDNTSANIRLSMNINGTNIQVESAAGANTGIQTVVFAIDLIYERVQRFKRNQRFTVHAEAIRIGESEPVEQDSKEVIILLPVVLIPGINAIPFPNQRLALGGDFTFPALESFLEEQSEGRLNASKYLGNAYCLSCTTYRTIYTLEYRENQAPFSEAAGNLYNLLREIKANTFAESVNLVGHSKGGLVGRQFDLYHPDSVRQLIMCQTPHLGSIAATAESYLTLGFFNAYRNLFPLWPWYRRDFSRLFEEARPTNEVLRTLNTSLLPRKSLEPGITPYSIIYSDNILTPITVTGTLSRGYQYDFANGDGIVPDFSALGVYQNGERIPAFQGETPIAIYMLPGYHFGYMENAIVMNGIFRLLTGDMGF